MKIYHLLFALIAFESSLFAKWDAKKDLRQAASNATQAVERTTTVVVEAASPTPATVNQQTENLKATTVHIEKVTNTVKEKGAEAANVTKSEAKQLTQTVNELAAKVVECDEACRKLKEAHAKAAPEVKARVNALAHQSERLTKATMELVYQGQRIAANANKRLTAKAENDDDDDEGGLIGLLKDLFGKKSKKSGDSSTPPASSTDKNKQWIYVCRLGSTTEPSKNNYADKATAEKEMHNHESTCQKKFQNNPAEHYVKTRAQYEKEGF